MQKLKRFFFLTDYKNSIAENDIVDKHRLKLFKMVTVIVLILFITFITLALQAKTNLNYIFYLNIALFSFAFLNYFFLNIHKNKNIAYSYNIVLFFILLHLTSYISGGILNSGNAYYVCLILYTYMLCGKKAGLICVLAIIVNLIYFYFISEFTNLVNNSINNENPSIIKIDHLITFVVSVFLIWSQSQFLQKTHNEIVENIINSNKQIVENEKEKEQLKRLVVENELKALRAQMNPHFTFNVMNSIQYYLSNNQTDIAQTYLTKFSKLIRKVLDNSKKNLVSVNDEIEALTMYVELEQIRFSKKFSYQINIDDSIQKHLWYIPSMLMQPYVENAIKHGFATADYNGTLLIDFIKNTATTFQCIITDNGIGIQQSKENKKGNVLSNTHTSYGLKITEERVKMFNTMYNTAAFIQIIDIAEPNKTGTKVIIELPIMED